MQQILSPPVGELVRGWRRRRRLSQLDLALDAEISARHLSFVETGRSRPSRSVVLRLAERLRVPPRERNTLLVAAGFAPATPERRVDDPELAPAIAVVERVLASYEPFPALAIDRHWTLVRANQALGSLIAGAAAHLLEPPVNVLRLSLHPEGVAPRIDNLAEWKAHICERVEAQVDASGDPVLAALLDELRRYPAGPPGRREDHGGIAVPLRLRTPSGVLSFLSMTTIFGTPVDVTLAELAIEAFLPADEATAAVLLGGERVGEDGPARDR